MRQWRVVVSVGVALTAYALLQTSCTRKPKAPETARVDFVYQSNRYAELEPCGCKTTPFGGIDREYNVLEKLRSAKYPMLYADAGNMLAPEKRKAGLRHYQHKAESLVKMLNEMGLQVFAPGPTDYYLTHKFLKKMQGLAKFSFVSTNVALKNGRPAFSAFETVKVGDVVYGFVSVTPEGELSDKNLKVTDAEKALAKTLPDVKKKAHVVVLLSQLDHLSNEKLGEKFADDIQIVVGSDKALTLDKADWIASGKTLIVDSLNRGFRVGHLHVWWKFPFKGFYSPTVVAKNKTYLTALETRVKDKNKKKADWAKKRLAEVKTRNIAPIEGGSRFSHRLISPKEETHGQSNKITEMKKAYKEEVRQRALAE